MNKQREIRRKVDELIRSDKRTWYSMEGIAEQLGEDESEISAALLSVVRCPFTSCQSFDTAQTEKSGKNETHHCWRCNRDFAVQREEEGYAILGWCGE